MNIQNIALPKSPYLKAVCKKFENLKSASGILQDLLKPQKGEPLKHESLMNIAQPTSPYIDFASKNLTKEQRKAQL